MFDDKYWELLIWNKVEYEIILNRLWEREGREIDET